MRARENGSSLLPSAPDPEEPGRGGGSEEQGRRAASSPAGEEEDDETNFQKASCTLEAAMKIYSLRVDSVHSEAYKVLGGINRAGRGKRREDLLTAYLGEGGNAEPAQEEGTNKKDVDRSTLLRSESKNLNDTQLGSELGEGIPSFDHCFAGGDNINKDWADSIENGFHNCRDSDDYQISGQRFLKFDGYRCYIHPFIKEKLRNLWDHILKQNKHATYYNEELSCPHDQNLGGSSTKLEQLADIAAADQVSEAKSSGILEHSPHDGIEGEIVYLQSRLLNDVVAMKQRYEDLILKVIQSLSHELDSFNKRKWDHILAHQYLRDIGEAKKRGNTERRHKEAQAILAAAAPSVASTSRNAAVRKETENDSIPKVNTGSSRVSQLTSLPQTKDSSFSNSKVSADTNFGIFDLATTEIRPT